MGEQRWVVTHTDTEDLPKGTFYVGHRHRHTETQTDRLILSQYLGILWDDLFM